MVTDCMTILTNVLHFQNDHSNCDNDSSCRKAPYIPSFAVVTNLCAVKLLTDFIHDHTIDKSPVDYLYGRDTGYIESCNNVAFIYLINGSTTENRPTKTGKVSGFWTGMSMLADLLHQGQIV